MNVETILGVWSGTAENDNGFELKITVSITEPPSVGTTLGTFTIPEIPCSGTFKVVNIRGGTLELEAEDKQGECGEATSDSLELRSDGTLLYVSRGEGWEARGILRRKQNEG